MKFRFLRNVYADGSAFKSMLEDFKANIDYDDSYLKIIN